MKPADILLMFEFNYWANHLLLDKTARLNPEALIQPQDFPFGNLKETLIHILDSEYVWRILCTEQQFKGRLTDTMSFPDLESTAKY